MKTNNRGTLDPNANRDAEIDSDLRRQPEQELQKAWVLQSFKLEEAENRRRTVLYMFLFVLAAALLGMAGVTITSLPENPAHKQIYATQADLMARVVELQSLTAQLTKELRDLNQQLETTSQDHPVAALLMQRMSALDDNIAAVQDAISADPLRTVSLPLMRKDIETLRERYKADLAAVREDAGRIYTFVQWCIGMFISASLGLGGLIITILRKTDPTKVESDGSLAPSAMTKIE